MKRQPRCRENRNGWRLNGGAMKMAAMAINNLWRKAWREEVSSNKRQRISRINGQPVSGEIFAA
jgi:hypothetical protein